MKSSASEPGLSLCTAAPPLQKKINFFFRGGAAVHRLPGLRSQRFGSVASSETFLGGRGDSFIAGCHMITSYC